MKKTLVSIISFLISISVYAQPYASAIMFGGTQSDVTMSVVGYGYNYATGYFSGSMDVGGNALSSAGSNDIFVVKYNIYGGGKYNNTNNIDATSNEGPTIDWVKRFGGSGNDQAHSVTEGYDGVYVTGFFNGSVTFDGFTLTSKGSDDIFVVYITYEGNVEWAKSYGGIGSDRSYQTKIVFHPSEQESLFVTGYFSNTANFGSFSLSSAGATDAFLLSIDIYNGDLNWAKRMGGNGVDIGYAIGNDDDGNIYATGSFTNTADFLGTNLTSAGSSDAFFVKADYFTGTAYFAKKFGGTGADHGRAISYDYDENKMFLLMNFSNTSGIGGSAYTSMGGTDILLGCFTTSGTFQWDYPIQGTGNDTGVGMEFLYGKVFIVGNFTKTIKLDSSLEFNTRGGSDYFLAIVNNDSSFQNGSHYGGENSDAIYGMCLNYSGLLTAGVYNGTDHFYDDLGTSPRDDEGKGDAFIGEIGIGF